MKNKSTTCRRVQNVLIVLLSLCALFLLGKTQLFSTFLSLSGKQSHSASYYGQPAAPAGEETVRPLGIYVSSRAGSGAFRLGTGSEDRLFSAAGEDCIRAALAAVSAYQSSTEKDWKAAFLQEEVLFWDYGRELQPLPADTEPSMAEAAPDGVRMFLLCRTRKDELQLLAHNPVTGAFYSCLLRGDPAPLKAALSRCLAAGENNPAMPAFLLDASLSISPYTLVFPAERAVPAYRIESASSQLSQEEEDRLLLTLGFNPQAISRYLSAHGMVYREGEDSLRLTEDGILRYYHAKGEGDYRYPLAAEEPSVRLRVGQRLFSALAKNWGGSAELLFRQEEDLGDGLYRLTFDYLLTGLWVRMSDRACAGEIILSAQGIEEFSLLLRRYVAAEEETKILPFAQALAAAEKNGSVGQAIALYYLDLGGKADRLETAWFAERS